MRIHIFNFWIIINLLQCNTSFRVDWVSYMKRLLIAILHSFSGLFHTQKLSCRLYAIGSYFVGNENDDEMIASTYTTAVLQISNKVS